MLTASPQFLFAGLSSPIMRLTLGIAPFSGILGFVTPMLVDRWSGGDPDHAGTAYAVNVVGCILGPLAAGFLLLPVMSERWVLFAFALPWLIIARESAMVSRAREHSASSLATHVLLRTHGPGRGRGIFDQSPTRINSAIVWCCETIPRRWSQPAMEWRGDCS